MHLYSTCSTFGVNGMTRKAVFISVEAHAELKKQALEGKRHQSSLHRWRATHAVIDPLWKSGRYSRRTVYARLSDAFGEDIHVGESDLSRCQEIIDTANRLFVRLKPSQGRSSSRRAARVAFNHPAY